MATHVHTTTTRPSRRNLFASTAALALAGIPAAAQLSPDADLIRLCAEFDALERERHGLDYDCRPGTPEDAVLDAETDRIFAAQDTILDAIERHPPTTLAGLTALARSALLEEAALHAADPHSLGGRLVWHMMDTLAEGRA